MILHCLAFSFLGLLLSLLINDASSSEDTDCPCSLLERPDLWKKEHLARWMVHSLDFGVLTTISTRASHVSDSLPVPFGNVYSFVDGPCDASTGIPYFYGTFMDQSFLDMKSNPYASLTLSEATFASTCGGTNLPACSIVPSTTSSHHQHHHGGDPEFPICARLTLTGTLVVLDDETSDEYVMAHDALYQRHTSMQDWPDDHQWVIAKLDLQDIWFIDYFGGASILNLDDYFRVELLPNE